MKRTSGLFQVARDEGHNDLGARVLALDTIEYYQHKKNENDSLVYRNVHACGQESVPTCTWMRVYLCSSRIRLGHADISPSRLVV